MHPEINSNNQWTHALYLQSRNWRNCSTAFVCSDLPNVCNSVQQKLFEKLIPALCPTELGSEHLWNVSQFLLDYTAKHPKRQLSSYLDMEYVCTVLVVIINSCKIQAFWPLPISGSVVELILPFHRGSFYFSSFIKVVILTASEDIDTLVLFSFFPTLYVFNPCLVGMFLKMAVFWIVAPCILV
jgi:hypothetical protein